MVSHRRRKLGAELVSGGVSFRVWAPARSRVSVVIESGTESPLERESDGYFSGVIPSASAGARYRFRLDDEKETYPDPASRYQPDGPHGPSEVVDPNTYRWRSEGIDVSLNGLVIYEMHIGTFTKRGTFASAIDELPHLADVGVNMIEMMPVHEFPGKFGWGYDGVDLWAPVHIYGSPDDLRGFVDAAHENGIAVILDVVYNHFGPDGCYLSKFAPDYFTKKYRNDWGESLNFDVSEASGARDLYVENAAYWIDEFRFDGLRLDATQSIQDDQSTPNVMREITDCARAAAGDRTIFIVGENEPQDVRLLAEYGLDAMWNDDWHHSAMVASTGQAEAYYTDYCGRAQEFVSMAKLGFLFQGQRYKWQKQRRGTPSHHIDPQRLVCYLQNHDQIANSATGARLQELTPPGRLRALTALLLLQPQTPMLFQGQEFASSSPFLYFADHDRELAQKVADGRREFLAQFPSIIKVADQLAGPADPQTFARSKLDLAERDRHRAAVDLHRDLIALRRSDSTISQQRSDVLHGSVLAEHTFILRWLFGDDADRLLVVNLGPALHFDPAPEPLLAPPAGCEWETSWSSESVKYGGGGERPPDTEENWKIPEHAAVLLRPRQKP